MISFTGSPTNILSIELIEVNRMGTWQERVKMGLKNKGLRYIDLANKLDVTEGAVSNYLNGNREPSFAQLKGISKMIDVPIQDLLSDTALPQQLEAAQLIKEIPEEKRDIAIQLLKSLAEK